MSAPIWNRCIARVTRTSPLPQALLIGLVLAALVAGAQAAHAVDSKRRTYSIPSGPLSQALIGFARDAGVLLSADARLTEGKQSPGLHTVAEGLARLLAGSGLAPVENADGSYTLRAPDPLAELVARAGIRPDYAQVTEPEPEKPKARPPTKDDQGPTVLPEMTVTATPGQDTSYSVPNATTATKTDTPIMETPFSIKVVPQQVLRDQQVLNIRDALRNIPGVVPWGGSQNVSDIFISRGFTNFRGVYRDGFQYFDSVGCCPTGLRETANVERIEFLKGPASILYGRVQPGGILNLVTKQPLATPYYSLQQQLGSYDFYRTTVDATGPLTSDDTWLYRFNLAYQDAGSFREFVKSDRVFVAPKLRWNIGPRTQVTLELEYMHNEDTSDLGNVPLALNATGNKPSPLSRDRNIGERWSTLEGDRVLAGLDWSHQFNDDWTLHHRFNFETFDHVFIGVFADSAAPDGTVQRGFFDVDPLKGDRYFTTLDLTGKFETWSLKHSMLIGGDYYRSDELHIELGSLPGGLLQASNIFTPVHQPQQPATTDFIDEADTTTRWYGLYLQDQIELPYNFHLLGGFRYDNAEIRDNLGGIVASEDDRISPRGGLVWRALPWLSLYGSYTENFGAANGQQASDGSFLPSQTAQQFEAGLKTEFWDGRLTSTFAYFDLTRQNQRTSDPTNPLRALLIGEAQSRGVEFDVAGELLPGWNIIAAYAYTPFAKVTQGNELSFPKVGNRFHGTPEHNGSLWSTYEFQDGNLKGLTLGAGVTAVDERVGDSENTYTLPGYAIVNLMARYAWDVGPTRVSAQLNVDNLLDKTYYLGTNGSTHIPFGNPLTLLGSLRVEY